jgi:tripartite-type tricarboxylate transporter receptor subunit TctC
MRARRVLLALLSILAAHGLAPAAHAQGWPQKPARIIVPFAPGGSSDGIARVIAQALSDIYGSQFIVENRPGAGGALAAEAVARSLPDGYTLFLAALPQIAIVPAMAKVTYDPVKDFAPISNIGTNPFVLAVHPSMPVSNVAEFIAYVGRQPGKLSYAASNIGSLAHLSMALFLKRAGLEMIPVAYKGGGTAPLTDVVAGHVPAYFTTLTDVLPHKATGALRLLAISSETRASQLPDIPTMIESGFPGFKTVTWNGLMAPAGTPKDIIDQIAKDVAIAVKDPKTADRLTRNGVAPLGNSPTEFAAMISADIPFWAEAVRIAGVQEK